MFVCGHDLTPFYLCSINVSGTSRHTSSTLGGAYPWKSSNSPGKFLCYITGWPYVMYILGTSIFRLTSIFNIVLFSIGWGNFFNLCQWLQVKPLLPVPLLLRSQRVDNSRGHSGPRTNHPPTHHHQASIFQTFLPCLPCPYLQHLLHGLYCWNYHDPLTDETYKD